MDFTRLTETLTKTHNEKMSYYDESINLNKQILAVLERVHQGDLEALNEVISLSDKRNEIDAKIEKLEAYQRNVLFNL